MPFSVKMPFSTPRPAPYITSIANLKPAFWIGFKIDEVLDGGDVGSLEVGERHAAALALQARRIQFAFDRLA